MVKGTITPFTLTRPTTSPDSFESLARTNLRTNSSSSVFPFRLSFDSSKIQRDPLLTLTLSTPSFLDTAITDELTNKPVYVIETSGRTTSILRANTAQGGYIKAASIRWPNPEKGKGKKKASINDILVRIGKSSWLGSEEFLVFGTTFTDPLPSTRKFMIQDYPDRLKWKHVGSHYHCVTSAFKTPVAILEPSTLTTPTRIKVFETLFKRGDGPKVDYRAIPIVLIDHLIVTAFLLLTDVEEWEKTGMAEAYEERTEGRSPSPTTPGPSSGASAESLRRWQALIRGSFIPPPRSARDRPSSSRSSASRSLKNRASTIFDSGMSQSSGSDIPGPTSPARGNCEHDDSRGRTHSFLEMVTPKIPAPEYHQPPESPPSGSHPPRSVSMSNMPTPSISTVGTLGRQRRELPTPPVAFSHPRPDQPWLHHSYSNQSLASPVYEPSVSATNVLSPISTNAPTTFSFEPQSLHSATTGSPQSLNPPRLQLHRAHSITSMRSPVEPSQEVSNANNSLPPKLARERRRTRRPATAPMRNSTARPFEDGRSQLDMGHQDDPERLAATLRDLNMVTMRDMGMTPDEIDRIYDQPPPAYDAIDFSLPRLQPPPHHTPRRDGRR
ncbi:hypothetical protein NEOLEDRAFT_1167149 [Neolentinus lepideus HHB14362 ss-1]|uniref:Uncharacterized protein n=1 Tax=Neolentinus lepideus HHB14362 ss-1 TaxID=1314782 RepID=A0A165V438_9AGAM|nr:hypothetical protein NEOLEDRAFT_1167149 [Neolentinus lepideus HHB14362 ss-1]